MHIVAIVILLCLSIMHELTLNNNYVYFAISLFTDQVTDVHFNRFKWPCDW